MNNRRRQRLRDIKTQLALCGTRLSDIYEEEVACFENMHENFQESERGLHMQESIEGLEDLCGLVEDAIEKTNQILE